ncbi:MAG: acyl-CoA dehydrogenase family protein, partial [Dehalococcoidia bacterium]
MVDFSVSPEVRELRRKVTVFMEEHIYPNEPVFHEGNPEAAQALMKELQAKTKAAGMWALFIDPEAGGNGTGFLPYAYVNEILGRSPIAPRAFGCAAPDTGNAEILHQFGSQEQKERWLKPLVAGEIRSCFSMTEPDVSGADPTGLQTRAVRDGDEWVINGHKWFTSGA